MQVSQAIRAIESSGPYVCTGLKGYSIYPLQTSSGPAPMLYRSRLSKSTAARN